MSAAAILATRPERGLPRVLIVDDSAVARALIARAVEADGRFEVAGAVSGVTAALSLLRRATVDAILLDVELPGVDGLSALPALIEASGGARVVMVSSSCGEGAAATVRALALGAADTLVKPGGGLLASRFAEKLLDTLDRLFEPIVPAETTPSAPVPRPALPRDAAVTVPPFDVVAIGASTGGIHALGQLLQGLPADFATPILVTQHLPASFMPFFAAQIAVLARRPCDVAVDRLRLRAGRVVVAPGDAHLRCVALSKHEVAVRLSGEASVSGCLPSVDTMFASLPGVFGERVLAVVLSGMGRDGATGARQIAAAGGSVVVQDRASSVVWGMPGAAAGVARSVLPPDAIGALLASHARPA